MKTINRLLVILFLGANFLTVCSYANSADNDEAIRRGQQQLDKIAKADQEAAAKRYDEQHPSSDGGGGIVGNIITFLILGFIMLIICVKVFEWGGMLKK